jgi:hypothetical protein
MAQKSGAEALNEFSDAENAQFEQMREGDAGTGTPEEQARGGQQEQRRQPAQRQQQQRQAPAKPTPGAKALERAGQDARQAPEQAEIDAEAGADQASEQRGSRTVPQQALHEERKKRQAAEAGIAERDRKLQELDTNFTRLQERTNRILKAMAGEEIDVETGEKKPPKREIPDVIKDPLGHVMGNMAELREMVQNVVGVLQQGHQQSRQATGAQAIVQRAIALEQEFVKERPDYNEASTFLREARDRQLQALGVEDPVERNAIIQNEAFEIARRSITAKKNPAERLYALAQSFGYVPEDAGEAGGEAEGGERGGRRAPAMDDTERLAQVRRGQASARSLSGVRGGSAAPLTAQRLLEMSEAEFDKAMATPAGRALMGH